jgi:peptidoglycan/LPS O-acetylase OafA/YrhL
VSNRRMGRPLVLLLAMQAILFLVSLPGLGLETRKFTDYAPWAGPIFLILTLVIFVGILAAIAVARRPSHGTASLAIVVAIAAVAIVLFDLSAIAGPPDPPGPLGVSAVVLVVSAAMLFLASREMREPPPAPP